MSMDDLWIKVARAWRVTTLEHERSSMQNMIADLKMMHGDLSSLSVQDEMDDDDEEDLI